VVFTAIIGGEGLAEMEGLLGDVLGIDGRGTDGAREGRDRGGTVAIGVVTGVLILGTGPVGGDGGRRRPVGLRILFEALLRGVDAVGDTIEVWTLMLRVFDRLSPFSVVVDLFGNGLPPVIVGEGKERR